MFESLKLSNLPQGQQGVIREPSGTRPVLWTVEEDGARAVVKDYSPNSFFYRNIIGRFLIWREGKAYRRLRGLNGIPACYRNIDGLALVIEEISGRSMVQLDKDEKLPEGYFSELRHLVETIHERGLVHCDLKRAPNILLGQDGSPHIVDWSASISKKECRFFPLTLLYKRFLTDDFNAIVKLKLSHAPESVGSEEKRRYYYRSKAEKLVRALRDRGRDLLQKIA